jgi:type IV secretion system protein VirB6/type IV secretion system protein TrbL
VNDKTMKFKSYLNTKKYFIILSAILCTVCASPVFAAPMNTNVLDLVLSKYKVAASAWGSVMVNYASWLFWGLVLISMVWTYGMMALRKQDIQEFLAETIRFFATTGFFYWILINAPAIGDAIIKSMWDIGAHAVGSSTGFTPGGILDIGFKIFFKVLDESSLWEPVDTAVGIIIALIILCVLTVIGVNLLLLFVSSWILVYGGIFFLGFGGSRWTSDMAINFYKTVLSVGAQLMAMLLLIGIGKTFVDQYYANMSSASNIKELGVMLVVSVVLLVLTNKIPPLIGGIVGLMHGVGTIGNYGAGAAMGAAGAAAAVAGAGAAMALAGASNIAGGASAVKSAFQSAQQHMSEGSGAFGDGGSGSAAGGSGSGGNGSGGFSSVMGTAGRFATDFGSNLMQGAGQVVKDKAATVMDKAKEEVGGTLGGQVASEIQNPGSTAQARQDRQDVQKAEDLRGSMRGQDARDFIASTQNTENFDGDNLSGS